MASAKEILYSARKREIKLNQLRDDIPESEVATCPNCGTKILISDLPYFDLCPKCLTSWQELIASKGLEYKDYNTRTRTDWGKEWYKYMSYSEIENWINETIEDYLNLQFWVSSIAVKYTFEGSNIYNKYYVDIRNEYETCLIDLTRFIHKIFANKTKTNEKRIIAINKTVTQKFISIYDSTKEKVEKEPLCNTITLYLQEIENKIKLEIEEAYKKVEERKKLSYEELIMQDDFLTSLCLTKEEMEKLRPHLNLPEERELCTTHH